jgi:carboxylesterase type B
VGQHDLIVALQWLQRYICNFGGDPGRVTITGSSTGAAAVALLLASKAAVGLFHNAWMNSITSFGSPDFFSEDIPSVFEHSTKPQMLSVGCGTLKCMKEFRLVNLFFDLRQQDSPLVVLSPDVTAKMPTYSWMAFDGLTIPNMFEVARTSRFASNKVPIMVGQALNEMDTLKFQFPLRRMLTNLIKDRLQSDGKDDAYSCIERKLLGSQGLQETAEDFMFNLGSYLAATRPAHQESGPRWHFLITAPASINGRSWHTQAELLSWGPDMSESSSQYDHLSKQFVLGKAPVELRRYGHKQFTNFVKTGQPADKNWLPTNTGAPGKLAGLPSKLYDTSPLAGNMHNQHSHSNHTITLLHDLLFDRSESKLLSDLEMHNCRENLRKTNSELEALRQNLTVYKKTDLIFALEIIRQANPLSILAEKVLNTGELPDMGEFVGGDDA